MARLGVKASFKANDNPLDRAYLWGSKGVEIDAPLLRNWLSWFTETNLELRLSNIKRRVKGPGAVLHHGTAIVLGVGVFILALLVDYNIIHEFWTRALSNEFGEVPPSMATTVTAKSMQVLFGTLAIHYLITHVGHGGRVAYSLLIFAITAVMIIGIGMLWANNSLPPGAQVFGFDVNHSAQAVDEFMKGLGIKPPRAAAVPTEVKFLKRYELIIWLFSLGVIFFVVASIGAMALHSAMRGFTGMTGGALYDTHHDARHGNMMRDELKQAELDNRLFHQDRSRFQQAKLSEFVAVYTDGVVSARSISGKQRTNLLSKLNTAVSAVAGDEADDGSASNVEPIDDWRDRKVAAQAT